MNFRVPGPCAISWGGNALGVTKAGVIIRSTPNWIPITDDSHGAVAADYLWAGRTIVAEIVGLDEALISAADLFANSLRAQKVIGEFIDPSDAGGAKTLLIEERDASNKWIALNTEPMPSELALLATQELQIPVLFLVIPDASYLLFSTLPAYIAAS